LQAALFEALTLMIKTHSFGKLALTGLVILSCSEVLPATAKTYNFIIPIPGIKSSVQASAVLSVGSLNFGGIAVDSSSPAQAVRLTNTGNIALAISAISTSGNFSATQNCGSGLSAGGVCTVDVVFTPATSGLLTGTLSITTALRAYSVDLSGTGQQAVTTVSPASLSFASQALATTSNAQIVTVTNAGSAPAALATPTVTGSFTVASTTCGTTLSAGASCTYSVTASPTVTGSSSGTLGVSTSVGTQTVTLTASGYATIVASGSTRIWSDGTMATSCYGYLNASGNYSYSGATGNGVYTITPGDGTPQPVYCDMTNDGGGWTLVMRGYGGSYYTDAYWNTTAALNLAYASTPNAPSGTTTFKLADGTINAIRAAGTGNYRTQSDGTYSYKRFWQSGTYGHTSVPPASAQETVSYATLGWAGSYAADPRWLANTTGISSAVYGGGLSDEQGAPSYFGVYMDTNRGINVGWIDGSGDASGPNYCVGSSANCNFNMWVR
jgi:hypothetical protein